MRIFPAQTNFTAGELTPRLYGRQDIDRYRNAAMGLENVFVLVQGGALGRYGLRYTGHAKHDNKHAVLIPYVFNRQQSYMLEFGDAYLRVFLQSGAQVLAGGLPYEIQTDYAEADLDQIDYVQYGDTLFLFHESYPVRRLRRFGDDSWLLDDVPWVTMPFDEVGFQPDTTLTVDDASVGAARTFTAGAATFLASDVGRQITTEGGVVTITSVTSATVAVGTIAAMFPGTSFAAGDWTITGSPQTQLTPYVNGKTSDTSDADDAVTIGPPDVGKTIELRLASAGWRASDVGKFVDFNDGLVKITSVTSATSALAIVYRTISAVIPSPASAWLLQSSVWGGQFGYPSTGTFFQQRLCLAGSKAYPQTVWGSRIGEYLDFELGTDDDEAFSFSLASEQQNKITHLTQLTGALVALTRGEEFTLFGTDSAPITPSNVNIISQSTFGCSEVSPERIGNELMFAQRSSKKIRALSADKVNTTQYGAPDLTVLAEHITKPGITGMAYQAEPEPLLFALRTDGQLATCTVDRDQDTVGWTRQKTDGRFDAIAALPVGDKDQVWAIVIRQVDGAPVRYVERFDDAVHTDSCVTGTSDTGETVWSGLDHLEGRTVKIVADGVEMPDQEVVDGAITLTRPAKTIEVGLDFRPRVKLLRPEINGQTGSAQLSNMRVDWIGLRFLETTGCYLNNAPLFARTTGLGVLDQPPPLFTGDKHLEQLGWDLADFQCVIEQRQPYPFHLQAVFYRLTANG